MKKYILMAVAAISAMTMTVSCDGDYEPDSFLSEVQVSSSYVSIDKNGGSTSIDVKAAGAWEITGVPEWLTVSPASGNGNQTVTFSAAATTSTNTCTVNLVCGGKKQLINVLQVTEKVETPLSTCAAVIAGADAVTYRIKGTVTAIANTTYGNMYINDGTGDVYIYGTLDASGAEKNFSSLGIEAGDIVTVEGPKSTFGTTVELVNVSVINIEKSLIKCDSLTVDGIKGSELPIEGGEIIAHLTSKGNGVTVNIPESVQDWLSVTGIETSGTTALVHLKATANAGGDRSASLTFNTTSSGKTYSATADLTQKGAIVACTVAEFNEKPVGTAVYRITAVVSSINNAAKGRFYIKDYSGETYVYNYSNFEAAGVKVGDIITITGTRAQYGEVIEMTNGNIEKIVPVTEVSIADFLTKEDSKDVYYMVKGTVKSIASAKYGNLYLTDGTNEVYVYGLYPGYGATGDARYNYVTTAGIEVGDELTMIGYKTTFTKSGTSTIELAGGFYVSHTKANPE